MADRGQARLKRPKGGSAKLKARRALAPEPLVYTAQDVAFFCEVDLKTIHHWADGGKIVHHRTEGRHLRFRRNHVIAFLRGHGYPIPARISGARPNVFLALPPPALPPLAEPKADDLAKKLSPRFFVRRFENALTAVAHVVAAGPDALVVSDDDPTWNAIVGIRVLKSFPDTAWPLIVVLSARTDEHAAMKEAGADLVVTSADTARLHLELARMLSVD